MSWKFEDMVLEVLYYRLFTGITRKWCYEWAKNISEWKTFLSKSNFLFGTYIISAVRYGFTINSSQKTSQTIHLMTYNLREVLHFLQCYNAHQCAMVVEYTTDGSDSRTTKRFFFIENQIMLLDDYNFYRLSKKLLSLAGQDFQQLCL